MVAENYSYKDSIAENGYDTQPGLYRKYKKHFHKNLKRCRNGNAKKHSNKGRDDNDKNKHTSRNHSISRKLSRT